MFRDTCTKLIILCKIQKKHQLSIALILVLASLAIAIQILPTSDWRQRVTKPKVVARSPTQLHIPDDQTRQVLPQCIIAGVRKCGTRALLNFLRLHTDVETASREIHFFDVDTTYKKGLEWYRQQMPASRPNQLTMEKTPHYFIEAQAPERVKHMNSSIRLLFIVKDPVVRMVSDYVQVMLLRNKTNPPKFEDLALANTSSGINLNYKALLISVYHLHLRRWLRSFNRSQIHIVDGDALISDPAAELRKVETFLGLEHQLTSDMFHRSNSTGFYCSKIKCLNSSKGRKHPAVPQEVLDKLCKFFRPHNQLLFKLVGQEFNWC